MDQEQIERAAVRRHVCVIGAGTMGRGIAQLAVAGGHLVSLVDPDPGQLAAAFADVQSRLARKNPDFANVLADRLRPAPSIADTPAHPDTIVIEAVIEDIEVKRSVFSLALEHFGVDCILATNTSSLSITEIAAQTSTPARVVGMHFFNPVPVMKLVEVVVGLQTDPAVAETVEALGIAWGKTVAHVRSAPGFIVNRVARPFYGEALKLLEEGAATPQTIDEVLRCAGNFRMGPFELMDLIGNDVNFKVTKTVWSAFNFDPRFAPSQIQAEIVAAGRYGRKSGHGFYSYDPASPQPVATPTISVDTVPAKIVLHGTCPQLTMLLNRSGINYQVTEQDGPCLIELGDLGYVLATTGRTAQHEAALISAPVAVLDRCLDPGTVQGLALAATDDALLGSVISLLGKAGVVSFPISDTPGLIVARIVAMIANEAWEAALHQIASPDDIDTAMVLGTNYPLGPFAWSARWSPEIVLQILDELATEYRDPRYRASQKLRANTRKAPVPATTTA